MNTWLEFLQLTLALSIGGLGWTLLRLAQGGVASRMHIPQRTQLEHAHVVKRQAFDSEG
jgi:hypothetical protein